MHKTLSRVFWISVARLSIVKLKLAEAAATQARSIPYVSCLVRCSWIPFDAPVWELAMRGITNRHDDSRPDLSTGDLEV